MDSELIPLESGETCVAAIMTAQSDNSKRIIAAQKIDKDISIVHDWLSAGHFPECVQEFSPAKLRIKGILDWPEELIPGCRGHIVAHLFSHRVSCSVGRTIVLA